MRKIFVLLAVLALAVGTAGTAAATNGDNLIGIGPISRAMGGVGIAAPQDAISATFANPAGMCFGPYCPGSEVNFAGTLFMPRPETKLTGLGPSAIQKDSDKKVYAIPAFGLSIPINPKLRFGLSAYGVSGLGVDYRDTGVPNNLNTQLQIMKFSPNIAYLVNDNLSVGLGLHIDYSALDLGSGTSFNYGVGAQVGAIYKVSDYVSLGITYKTPQNVDHENVSDFDGDTALDDLELESPQELGIGVAVEPMPGKLLIEVNAKWVNWGDAKGYEDFDWDDQYVIAVGAQFKPTEKLALRLGYNYGENPVQVHDNFDGTTSTNVQGKSVNTFNYEFLRIVGFPAIVEHHLTAGIGYEFSDAFAVNLGYMHAFEETITENGTIPTPVILESTLEEDSLEFGMTWRF
ncbi:MAG: outer membrane protein transport protein [Nitrospirota bacterium]|jgi:long-chain fatty acid transport protein